MSDTWLYFIEWTTGRNFWVNARTGEQRINPAAPDEVEWPHDV